MARRGIILAGGTGTRLHPLTVAVSKQLLAIYDKPMVYYPLTTLMLAGIRSALIITTPGEQELFRRLLGDGSQWGMEFEYAIQDEPRGIADAFRVGKAYTEGRPTALVLGDNVFYGHGLQGLLRSVTKQAAGATIFGYRVKDPSAYGVAEFDDDGRVKSLEEKPAVPRSNHAVVGLYFYDGQATDMAHELRPSARGELEITDLNRAYLAREALHFEALGRGVAWLDTGTPDGLLQAASFIQAIQARQGLYVACPEEIAFNNGWIDVETVLKAARGMAKTAYGEYLVDLVRQKG